MKYFYCLLTLTIVLFTSCFFSDPCEGEIKEQLFKFGNFELNITSGKDTLKVDDSIRIKMVLPNTLLDSNTLTQIPIEDITVQFLMTRVGGPPKDTALIYVFDQYFEILMNKGENVDPYNFVMEKSDSVFELDFKYVCKKKLEYYLPIGFKDIIVPSIDLECMNGDVRTWSARLNIQSDYNLHDGTNFTFIVN